MKLKPTEVQPHRPGLPRFYNYNYPILPRFLPGQPLCIDLFRALLYSIPDP